MSACSVSQPALLFMITVPWRPMSVCPASKNTSLRAGSSTNSEAARPLRPRWAPGAGAEARPRRELSSERARPPAVRRGRRCRGLGRRGRGGRGLCCRRRLLRASGQREEQRNQETLPSSWEAIMCFPPWSLTARIRARCAAVGCCVCVRPIVRTRGNAVKCACRCGTRRSTLSALGSGQTVLLGQRTPGPGPPTLSGCFEMRRMARFLHHLDARARESSGELLRVREGHQPIVLAPDQERRRLDPVHALPEALVGDRPDELARASHGPDQAQCEREPRRLRSSGWRTRPSPRLRPARGRHSAGRSCGASNIQFETGASSRQSPIGSRSASRLTRDGRSAATSHATIAPNEWPTSITS